MKVLICVCFIVFVNHKVTGQSASPVCSNVNDFGLCLNSWSCDTEVSSCTCFDEQPYCRCNNLKGEFYIDEDCSQKWTLVTFVLVATLPGVTLAILVGTIVYVIMLPSSKSKKSNAVNSASSKKQDLFPGITSDLNGQPATNTTSVPQKHIPMINISNRAGMPSKTHEQAMGGPSRPYSSSNMNSYPDGKSQSYSTRDPPMEGPARPYSSSPGYGQTINNPYTRDSAHRSTYDSRSALPDQRNDYRQPAFPHPYEDVNKSYSPAPYSSDRGNSRGGFPRPHVNPQYY